MQAVVLVGGEGTRLRPLTYATPKPMVPIFGVPFLERTLARLKAAGVEHAILAAGYLPDQITEYFGDGSALDMRLTYVIEDAPLGTAGALKNVERYIEGPFFVLNGDVLTSLDLRAMAAFHKAKAGVATLHLITVDDPSAFGAVVHDGDGRVSSFIEKPAQGTSPTNDVNAGTYLLQPEILDAIPAGRPVSIERETFPALIAAGRSIFAFTTSDYWIDIGRPEQYVRAHSDVFSSALELDRLCHRSEPGTFYAATGAPPGIVGPAFVGEGSNLLPGSVIGPFTTLGRDVRVEEGARVEASILWDSVIVEGGALVRGAIVASGARIGAGAVVEAGAVIGHGVTIAPGARVEPGARIGREQYVTT